MNVSTPTHRKNHGFSLLEIIIVTGIVGLTAASGYASYKNFNDKQEVIQVKKEVVTELRKVKKMAESGEKPASQCGNSTDTLEYYQLSVNGSGNLDIHVDCGSGPLFLSSKNINDDVSVSFMPSQIQFLKLSEGATPAVITVQNSDASIAKTVTVDSGGTINEND